MDFKASVSLVGTMRWSMYGAALVGVVIGWGMNGFSWEFLLAGGALMAFFYFAVDRLILSKAPRIGDVVVSLKLGSIDAPLFNTKRKSYLWSEIESAKVDTVSGATVLELKLLPAADRPDKRAFLDGVNHARPFVPLQSLSPTDQEQLLDAVLARLQGAPAAGLSDSATPVVNDLTLVRQLDERLKAMAPTAWLTLALIALNVGVWLVTASLGVGWMTGSAEKLYEFGGNTASAVQGGQWWRLLTATFLHANLLHLLFNMIGLWATGVTVERIFGRRSFALIYLAAALAGSVASLYFSAQTKVSVGASGAVFGVAGALLIVVFQQRRTLPKLFNRQILSGMAAFVGYSLLLGFSKAGVDNAAHLGGLAAGVAMGLVLPGRFDLERHARLAGRRTLLALLLLAAVLPWATLRAPVAREDVGALIQAQNAIPPAARAFDAVIHALKQDVADVKAGKMSDKEADDRSRSVHAPRMQSVVTQLEAIRVAADDPRAAVVSDLLLMSRALHESLAMDSVEIDGKMQPADGPRAAQLSAEMQEINARMLRRQGRKTPTPSGD